MSYIWRIIQAVVFWFQSRGPVREARYQVAGFDYSQPGVVTYAHKLPDTSTSQIYAWEAPEPRVRPKSAPVEHAGADDNHEWAAITADMRQAHKPLTAELKRALLTDTGVWDIVKELDLEPAESTVIEDELGLWDPEAVDWEEPAIFLEVSYQALAAGELTVPIAEDEFVTAVMRRVLAVA